LTIDGKDSSLVFNLKSLKNLGLTFIALGCSMGAIISFVALGNCPLFVLIAGGCTVGLALALFTKKFLSRQREECLVSDEEEDEICCP
jgi:hypothetical protein